MSSEILSGKLTDKDVNTLNKVLLDAGYTGTTLQGSAGMNVAAKLVIRLFHKGVTDPLHYTTELESAFGRPQVALYAPKGLHRYAIRGLPPANDEGFPSPNETPEEEKNVIA
jgi:hypothetical protein